MADADRAPLWNTRGDPCPTCGEQPTGYGCEVATTEGRMSLYTPVLPPEARLTPCGHAVTTVDTGATPSFTVIDHRPPGARRTSHWPDP